MQWSSKMHRTSFKVTCRLLCVVFLIGFQANGAASMTTDTNNIEAWLEQYKRSWQQQDPDLVATLFTENARYAVNPLEHVLNGRAEIRAYWNAGGSGSQKNINFEYEIWSVTAEMVIVHWTASFTRTKTGEHVKMDGVFRLIFAPLENGGLICSTLEEWWFLAVAEP